MHGVTLSYRNALEGCTRIRIRQDYLDNFINRMPNMLRVPINEQEGNRDCCRVY